MAIFLFIQETANAFLSVYTPFDSDDTFALRDGTHNRLVKEYDKQLPLSYRKRSLF